MSVAWLQYGIKTSSQAFFNDATPLVHLLYNTVLTGSLALSLSSNAVLDIVNNFLNRNKSQPYLGIARMINNKTPYLRTVAGFGVPNKALVAVRSVDKYFPIDDCKRWLRGL